MCWSRLRMERIRCPTLETLSWRSAHSDTFTGNLMTSENVWLCALRLEVGRLTDTDIDIAIFEKTETDTDTIFRKTEKYRLLRNKNRNCDFFRFSSQRIQPVCHNLSDTFTSMLA